MGLFDKVAKTAANVGSSASVAVQEQNELIALKTQINVIEQELNSSYIQIGRKYVDYVIESGDMPGIDVSDILKLIDPKLTKKFDLEKQIIELEKEIKAKNVLREKQQAEEAFLAEKAKLDKALGMDIISQDEYDIKVAIARKKVDNFEMIRKIEQQAEMGLITKEEKAQKIEQLLN